ncbi:MAG: glycosyltransferase, partial [bacterium]|nr:glycosyltransferase [bacterium]
MRVCIVIPMHNEETVAERCVRMVFSYLNVLPHTTTLCVVNDGSGDTTPAVLARVASELHDERFRIVHHEVNHGY